MGNKGKVTIFICLIISSMLLVFTTIGKILNLYSARQKVAMCGRIALSNVRSEYNRYVFDNYHILLFDLNCQGKGEGALEKQMETELQGNLGKKFVVEEAAITDYVTPVDNSCAGFKEQIAGYMVYAAVESGADAILDSTGGDDGTLSTELENQLEEDSHSKFTDETADREKSKTTPGNNGRMENSEENENYESETDVTLLSRAEDPRNVTTNVDKLGILYFVIPEGMDVSGSTCNKSGLPSMISGGNTKPEFKINCKFDDYEGFRSELDSCGGWGDDVVNGALGIFYANKVFNCATDKLQENSVFVYEREYLICGRESDYKNLEGVITKIAGIRLPVNYSYLMSSTEKLGKIRNISVPISLTTGVPEPILKHLIGGCWAYVEGLAEIRGLLTGKKLAFKKNSGNWITDLSDLCNSMYGECKEAENGLTYEDYLTVLMALTPEETLHLRMLDIIQLNAGKNGEDIDIVKSGMELSVNYRVKYGDEYISYNMTTGY